MWFVAVGVILILLNLLEIGPIGEWTWTLGGDLWKFALPFVFAVGWWAWSDASGLTKRRQMERMDEKRELRREKNMEALGLKVGPRRKHKP
jgi:small Trp-rich protein